VADPSLPANRILAIDVGATFTKSAFVDPSGSLIGDVRRERTTYPCTPSGLVGSLTKLIVVSGCNRVGVGVPVALEHGKVVGPGSFACAGGPSSAVDDGLMDLWLGFSPEDALRQSTRRDVRVVNDAALAALGCADGRGTELVLTLGTGLGLGLVVDGQLRLIPDVGWDVFREGETFDEAGGDEAMKRDLARWNSSVLSMVEYFAHLYGATTVHLAGGNARSITLDPVAQRGYAVVVNSNDRSLQGAARLFGSF